MDLKTRLWPWGYIKSLEADLEYMGRYTARLKEMIRAIEVRAENAETTIKLLKARKPTGKAQ